PQQKLLKDKEIGEIFMHQMRAQFFVDTTIWVAFALQPIVTFHDLETAILKGTDFKHLERGGKFSESGLGNLMYHPMVRHFLLTEKAPGDWPSEFPKITGEQLLHLMVNSWTENFSEKKFENTWSLESALMNAAQHLGLSHFRHIGVYVQREHVVKVVMKQALSRKNRIIKEINKLVKSKAE
ncbi:Uncharacterized protein SCF082_LOCUS20254, partial [Durusdinium trenchii]